MRLPKPRAGIWSQEKCNGPFTSDRDGSPEIYLMNADGSAMSRLTHDGDKAFPAWSPDGEKIVFLHGLPEIYP